VVLTSTLQLFSDPATAAIFESVGAADQTLASDAIQAAAAAHKLWSASPAAERSGVLFRLFDLMQEHADTLAEVMTLESGKPMTESQGEVQYAASYVRWFAAEARRAYGSTIPGPSSSHNMLTLQQPVGVCALITPWNFPLAMLARKVAPAIAAGCASVLKPAEDTPVSALLFAALAQDAGLPAGVLNVIPCERQDTASIGELLCASPDIAKVSFTGSTAVGKLLLQQCADTCKKTSMELGGNAPLIVFNDADIEKAVQGTLDSKFRFGGQTCVSANRVMVQEGVLQEYLDLLSQRVSDMTLGDPMQHATRLGPLINQQAADKAQRLRKDALAKGAEALTGGDSELQGLPEGLKGGYFVPPTVLSGVTSAMACSQEEVFGPIAAVSSFACEDEVLQRANDTRTGLAAYVFTRNMARSWRMSKGLQAGMVAVNDGLLSSEAAPFGGVLESGLGREGGASGLGEYMETKYVLMNSSD